MQSTRSRSFLLVLFCVEIVVISLIFDSEPLVKSKSILLNLLAYSVEFIRMSFAIVGGFIIFGWPRRKDILLTLQEYNDHPLWKKWLIFHFISITLYTCITSLLFKGIVFESAHDSITVNLTALSWILAGVCTVLFLFFSIAPLNCWSRLIKQEIGLICISISAGVLAWFVGGLVELSWQPLAGLTFSFSYHLLSMVYPDVVVEPINKILGTSAFQVNIAPQCSGYEGIGLIVGFLIFYMVAFRKSLRFPHVYLLFPIGITTIWILNTFRIVLLIAIGSSYSSEIAASGFHSNAGWIVFVLISAGLILLCQQMSYFNVEPKNTSPIEINTSLISALLLPFVILLSTIILTSAFTVDFNWLYPLRVITAGLVLWYFRNQYRQIFKDITFSSLFIGFIGFISWLLLVDTSEKDNHIFIASLSEVSPLIASSWFLFRFVGATITVPIIEELAFRGYLIKKLTDTNFVDLKTINFTWLSFLGSSILFGILHGEWIAGTIAGMGYAIALYRRGAVSDAIAAHMTTNVLLTFFVMFTGNWFLW